MRGNRRLHWRRYRQIIGVLVSNGFGLLLEQLGILAIYACGTKLDSGSIEAAANAGCRWERLRLSCEQWDRLCQDRPDFEHPSDIFRRK